MVGGKFVQSLRIKSIEVVNKRTKYIHCILTKMIKMCNASLLRSIDNDDRADYHSA